MNKNLIKYEVYLQELNKSKTILDVTNQNQDGLSLRVMEALFFNKKLITTNDSIRNYDFYKKENIFILKDGFEQGLKEFLKIPYCEVEKDIKEYYSIENWVARFIQEGEENDKRVEKNN